MLKIYETYTEILSDIYFELDECGNLIMCSDTRNELPDLEINDNGNLINHEDGNLIYYFDNKGNLICNHNNWTAVLDLDDYFITHKFDGRDTLEFNINPKDKNYKYIKEENILECNEQLYIIKKINERKTVSTVDCELYLDDLKKDCFNIDVTDITLSQLLFKIMPHIYNYGVWTYENDNSITCGRTVRLENVNVLDILLKAEDIYGCTFNFDTFNKIIKVVKYNITEPTGKYLTDELNLKSVTFKGDSSDFCTRLIGYGKKDEDTGKYLDFTSINDGKNYVENYTYSNKIITKAFVDERFTVIQDLKDEAIERLKTYSIPKRSYECEIVDIAKINEKYKKLLDLKMYDIITLIDNRRNTTLNHRIVEYKDYPMHSEKNVITLSTEVSTITGVVSTVNEIINDTGNMLDIGGVTFNELKRDVDSNSVEITKRYTKGETNTILQSSIQQSADNIVSTVAKTYETKADGVNRKTIISSINQSAEDISINAEKINLNGAVSANNYFTIGVDGKVGIKDGTINITGENYNGNECFTNISKSGFISKQFWGDCFDLSGDLFNGVLIYPYEQKNDLSNTNTVAITSHSINVDEGDTLHVGSGAEITKDMLYVGTSYNNNSTITPDKIEITGNLKVSGTKNRVVKTKDYGELLQNALETPTPTFEDYGEGKTDDKGNCRIYLDDKFSETIDINTIYNVFLTKYGQGDIYVSDRQTDYFEVKGTANLSFSWQLLATQKDYNTTHLDENIETAEMTVDNTDYMDIGSEFLNNYESELK